MKPITTLAAFVLALALTLLAQDHDHGEVGIFVDYLRVQQLGDLNQVGVGGRAGFNVHHNVALEAEMAWDFNRAFTENCSGCLPVQTARSGVKILHGLFGPKFQVGSGAARAFVTVKGGFINFRFSPTPATFGNFASDVEGLRTDNVDGVLYPGGGVEFFAGPFGIRFDAGDEIYFQNGAHHNLRLAAGPNIRF